MSDQAPAIVSVHGAFAESASGNPVIAAVHQKLRLLAGASWWCQWWDQDRDGDHG